MEKDANAASTPRFARVWRGRTSRGKADEYESYLLKNGIKPLEEKGALGVQMFREDGEAETEFVTISYWESVEAMSRSKDEDPRQVHHLERDPEFLIELPRTVQILTILESRGAFFGGGLGGAPRVGTT